MSHKNCPGRKFKRPLLSCSDANAAIDRVRPPLQAAAAAEDEIEQRRRGNGLFTSFDAS
jgi:hypothetical protein